MKKIILTSFIAFFSVLSALAIPTGLYKYVNRSGRVERQVLVDNTGKTLYVLDREGNVKTKWYVIEETQEDGGMSFILKSDFGAVLKRNGWWRGNGNVYMNIQDWGVTLTKED